MEVIGTRVVRPVDRRGNALGGRANSPVRGETDAARKARTRAWVGVSFLERLNHQFEKELEEAGLAIDHTARLESCRGIDDVLMAMDRGFL